MGTIERLKKVLITCRVDLDLINGLSKLGFECTVNEQPDRQWAIEAVKDCSGIVTSTKLEIDREIIDAGARLEWIGRMGSGMEIVDVEYAAAKGIGCYSSPEGNRNAVGEHALGMLLSLVRHIHTSYVEMQQGIWKRDANRGIELEGRTLGIIGFGNAGSAFAKKLAGFDLNILAYDKYRPENICGNVVCCPSLERIFEEAEIISFHVPLQKDTMHYFNREFCDAMKRPFILINTSRGPVLDTEVVLQGLQTGKIIGLCMDVFEEEPPFAAGYGAMLGEIIKFPNVVVTPHIAGYTHEAIVKMSRVLLKKISEQMK